MACTLAWASSLLRVTVALPLSLRCSYSTRWSCWVAGSIKISTNSWLLSTQYSKDVNPSSFSWEISTALSGTRDWAKAAASLSARAGTANIEAASREQKNLFMRTSSFALWMFSGSCGSG